MIVLLFNFRNLFFRTIYLILGDINPIFVLEGDAPELKRDVMAARNAIQFRGAAPRADTGNKRPDIGRKRFKGVQREVFIEIVLYEFMYHIISAKTEYVLVQST